MIKRSEARVIPNNARYFQVLTESGSRSLRFPSFQDAAALVELIQPLQGAGEGEGIGRLISLLDVAGYAIGLFWFDVDHDLNAGKAPSVESNEWRAYGRAVTDELQEEGATLADIMLMVNRIIESLGSQMSSIEGAQVVAKNS